LPHGTGRRAESGRATRRDPAPAGQLCEVRKKAIGGFSAACGNGAHAQALSGRPRDIVDDRPPGSTQRAQPFKNLLAVSSAENLWVMSLSNTTSSTEVTDL